MRIFSLLFALALAGCSDDPQFMFPDAGVNVHDLALKSGTVLGPAQTLSSCLASDGNALYWADQGAATNRVMKLPLSGGAPVTLASGGDERACVVVDETSAYYVDGDALMKVPSTGGGSPAPVVMKQHFLKDLVAVQGGFAYWITDVYGNVDAFNGKNAVVRVPVSGGTIETIYAQVNGGPGGLRVDADNIYYSDLDGMFARTKGGGAGVTYGMSTIHSNTFAVDGTHLVMDEVAAIGMGDVAVMRLDGMARVVVSMNQASALAIDASGVYGRQDNHLVYFSLDGKTTKVLAAEAPRAIVLDTMNVYFTDGASILKVAKPM